MPDKSLNDWMRDAAERLYGALDGVTKLATDARLATINALLVTIDADTSKIPASPATEDGNLASILALLQAPRGTTAGHSYGELAADNTWKFLALSSHANDDQAAAVPDGCQLTHLSLTTADIAGAASASVVLVRHQTNDVPVLLDIQTWTFAQDHRGAAAKSSYVWRLDISYDLSELDETSGTLYVAVKLNAGTATIKGLLGWEK